MSDKEFTETINFFKTNERFNVKYDISERNFTFAFDTGKRKLNVNLFVPLGYPNDRPLCFDEDGGNEKLIEKVNTFAKEEKTLLEIAQLLYTELCEFYPLKTEVKEKPSKEEEDEDVDGSEMEDEEDDGLLDEEEEYEEDELRSSGYVEVENKRMRRDVDEAISLFGASSFKLLSDLFMVRMFVDPSYLGEETCSAIGIVYSTPINFTLIFHEDYVETPYTNALPLKMEIDQKPHNEAFGLQFQLTEVVKKWLNYNWKRYQTDKGPALKSSPTSKSAENNNSNNSSNNSQKPVNRWERETLDLLDMGFDEKLIMYALQLTHGDKNEALTFILSADQSFIKEAETFYADRFKEEKKEEEVSTTRSDLVPNDFIEGRNFLVDLYIHVTERLTNISNYCPICDWKHEVEGIKPIVCHRKDCVWRYEELGLGASVSAEINHSPEMVDILVTMAYGALSGARAEKLIDTFPSDFVDHTTQKPDFKMMKECIEKFPRVDELIGTDAKSVMELYHSLSYRLLRWIITSNRTHFAKLKESQMIKEMGTDHQYMMLTSTPEKEANFNELKSKHGSFLAFHGSPFENWHAILRVGLKNMSNKTGYMLHGAAHGAGIYLAPNSGTSTGYTRPGNGWPKSNFGSVSCIALCEVIDHSSVKGRDHKQWCYVVEKEEFVMARYFFFYKNGQIPGVVARDLKVPSASQMGVKSKLRGKKSRLS